MVNEGLADAILKRPSSILPSTTPASRSCSGARRNELSHRPNGGQMTPETCEIGTNDKTYMAEPVVEFEFPTLLERRAASPFETIANVDGVEIFH